MNKPILNKTERASLLTLACCLAAVSICCEVMLFTSQTNNLLDMTLATVTGFSLVGFQYVFAAVASHVYQAGKKGLACFLFAITAVLFAVSVSGTAGFFESRLQSSNQINAHDSNAYQLQLAVVEDLMQQEQELTQSAATSEEKGNAWYAGQLLEDAFAVSQRRQEAIETLNSIEATNTTTVSAIAGLVGQYRWVFWLLLAALVDVCPVVAFAAYRVQAANTKPNTQTTPVKTPAPQQAKQPPMQTPKQPATSPTVEQIKQYIKSSTGPVGVRKTMRDLNTTNHARIKTAFTELVNEGVLIVEGKSYQRGSVIA